MLTPTQRFVDQGTDLGAYLTATISFADGGGVSCNYGMTVTEDAYKMIHRREGFRPK